MIKHLNFLFIPLINIVSISVDLVMSICDVKFNQYGTPTKKRENEYEQEICSTHKKEKINKKG